MPLKHLPSAYSVLAALCFSSFACLIPASYPQSPRNEGKNLESELVPLGRPYSGSYRLVSWRTNENAFILQYLDGLYELVDKNVRTGQSKPFPVKLGGEGISGGLHGWDLRISPDEKWALHSEFAGQVRRWVLTELATGAKAYNPVLESSVNLLQAVWMSSSREWLEVAVQKDRTLLRWRRIGAQADEKTVELPDFYFRGWVAGIQADRTLLLVEGVEYRDYLIRLDLTAPNGPRIIDRKRIERMKNASQAGLAIHSPTGRVILAMAEYETIAHKSRRMWFWLTDVTGKPARRLGYLALPASEIPRPNMKWLPSGDRVSYWRRGKLYALKVD